MKLGLIPMVCAALLAMACGSSPDRPPYGASGAAGAAGAGGSSGAAGSAGMGGQAGSGGGAGTGTCSSKFVDPTASQRRACSFGAGAMPTTTLGLSAAELKAIPIQHIVVVMKENRSFDHLLGRLATEGQPGTQPIPATFSNPDASGTSVKPFHAPTTCLADDPGHQWNAMHQQVDSGKMDGFVQSAAASTGGDGHFVMGWYDQKDLPFYYWLASTYALDDRHFAAARTGTFPNRNFLLLGTADGVTCTGCGYPDPSTPTIFDELDKASVSWGAYSDGELLSGTLGWTHAHANTYRMKDFFDALDAGTLPQVTFVDGYENVTDGHPPSDLQGGEAWTRDIYEHAIKSPLWPHLALLFTYDESGGFFDHVPPPPDDPAKTPVCIPRDPAKYPSEAKFNELGARVPMIAISPYARQGFVSHTIEDHTALTRFIETVFDLPALTARDANSGGLLQLFDFQCPPALLHPPAAPAAGTHGCGGNTVPLSTDKTTYAVGESIQVSFAKAPGNQPLDWIGVYVLGDAPHASSLVWAFLGGSHTATTAPTSGTVTLGAGLQNGNNWPLPAGRYIAYYLQNNGYVSLGSVDFAVQ